MTVAKLLALLACVFDISFAPERKQGVLWLRVGILYVRPRSEHSICYSREWTFYILGLGMGIQYVWLEMGILCYD